MNQDSKYIYDWCLKNLEEADLKVRNIDERLKITSWQNNPTAIRRLINFIIYKLNSDFMDHVNKIRDVEPEKANYVIEKRQSILTKIDSFIDVIKKQQKDEEFLQNKIENYHKNLTQYIARLNHQIENDNKETAITSAHTEELKLARFKRFLNNTNTADEIISSLKAFQEQNK